MWLRSSKAMASCYCCCYISIDNQISERTIRFELACDDGDDDVWMSEGSFCWSLGAVAVALSLDDSDGCCSMKQPLLGCWQLLILGIIARG